MKQCALGMCSRRSNLDNGKERLLGDRYLNRHEGQLVSPREEGLPQAKDSVCGGQRGGVCLRSCKKSNMGSVSLVTVEQFRAD